MVQVIKDEETQELQNLFVQTSAMRDTFMQFPRILLFDHGYKINKNRMPVSLLMVMDGNGDGKVVGLSFLSNERKENICNTLKGFITSSGQDAIIAIKTVVIDKDMGELSALQQMLPRVQIQLCDFHVSNTFNGRCAHEDREVLEILNKLRFAQDDKEFKELVVQL